MLCIAKSTLSHNWASLPTGSSRRSQYCTTERIERWTWLSTAAAVNQDFLFPLPFNLPFDLNLGSWQTWVLGLVLALTPFGISTWWPILKSKVDSIMQTTETVAETVEKVADKVDKVAEDLADILPEGKLKQAARYIEDIAEEAEKDAHLVDEAIEKLEEIETGLKEEAERFVQTNAKSKEAENS
ncbi:PHAGE CAPSID SCAFFOLDING PROTEIN (GPO) SERINE PEPTIDASE [Salix koriyanagi]|uniref:PHAGE CAPSID SCAFFOLDING PROTEIN (GPO) SERINE PEPTIDASE n=1 Tax=Salix koriyanagi TaxID=2511006 RepID=A0A9Q0TDB8_9ROSI|nr:PHAGE CAPSID SCAFFOLDING PROTEIN (GPO) SERINE PEPTIDASE [Salix koriyanagi]